MHTAMKLMKMLRIKNTLSTITQYRPVEMKTILGGKVLGVYQKMSANLVSWLSRSFHGNILKCPEILNRVEVGNANSQHK